MLTRAGSQRSGGAPTSRDFSAPTTRSSKGKGRAQDAVQLPLEVLHRLLDFIEDEDVSACGRTELAQFARARRATYHAMSLTCHLWHHAASARRFDVLDLTGGHKDVRSVCNQLHTTGDGHRVKVIILDPDLVGVSSSLVKVLFSLCPRVETVIADAHFISALTSYPTSAKRILLGEAELVVELRLLAGAAIEHLSIEQCHRRVDGLTAEAMDLSAAAARHLERLEVSFAPDESSVQESSSDTGEGVVETMPSTLEWVIINGYRLKHLKLAGCGTRAINSALRKLARIAREDAVGLRSIELVVPAREKARGFVRDINPFMPASLVEYTLRCVTPFDAASVADDLVVDFFRDADEALPELRRIVILTDMPEIDADPDVARHLDLAFSQLEHDCDENHIVLERPTF